ncbi:putative ABC transporter ATP-binding protein YnjD [Labeo rohita]|uniref:ABC transporter ATP-binding protein YnjD n=1 Tax=Labeo rohita TaxID=84645 RepID=A0ABQ8L945_LABRO|nr:putative ABC transporter ATP-binding protein YnjD [Labeo rohita]
MADLPHNRITPDEPPFSRVGLDCFGPFEVKRGRTVIKRYGLIFTCLAIRAIHLEVLSSLDTDSFINGFRRFIARRGQVLEIRSDNGTNFVGAERELRQATENLNHNLINDVLLRKGVKWVFNPPAASHHGGSWERLIRSVRRVLNSVCKTQILDEESLATVFCEVEAIVNSRPITKASTDPQDLEALTPNHLLLLKSRPLLPPGLFKEEDVYSRRRWRQVQYMSDLFWKRWVKEYLPGLQERQKWNSVKRNFVSGDLVVLVDDMAPRNTWITGRIVDTVLDKNGLVRSVRIKTKTSYLNRPITKVCLLREAEGQ